MAISNDSISLNQLVLGQTIINKKGNLNRSNKIYKFTTLNEINELDKLINSQFNCDTI